MIIMHFKQNRSIFKLNSRPSSFRILFHSERSKWKIIGEWNDVPFKKVPIQHSAFRYDCRRTTTESFIEWNCLAFAVASSFWFAAFMYQVMQMFKESGYFFSPCIWLYWDLFRVRKLQKFLPAQKAVQSALNASFT